MDELAAVRELRADAPAPGAARLAAGRWKLTTAASAEVPGEPAGAVRRRLLSSPAVRRSALAGVTAAAVAAGVLVATRDSQRSGGTAKTDRTQTVAAVLEAAATAVPMTPDPKIGPGQWIYRKSLYCAPTCFFIGPVWIAADGSDYARIEDGKIRIHPYRNLELPAAGTPPTSRDVTTMTDSPERTAEVLAALPTDPRALLARISTDPFFTGGGNLDFYQGPVANSPQEQLIRIMNTLISQSALLPPRTSVALYHALGLINGVRLLDQPVKDAQGQPAQAIAIANSQRTIMVLFDRHTHTYRGWRMDTTNGRNRLSIAFSAPRTGIVDHPGQIPPTPAEVRTT